MDLQRGHIIVDDLTQSLRANLIGMSLHDAAISVKANYAILRCPYFDPLGIKPQDKTDEICCYTFN
jgi:hypothetical protein